MKKLLSILFFIIIIACFDAFAPVTSGWKLLATIVYIFTIAYIMFHKEDDNGDK